MRMKPLLSAYEGSLVPLYHEVALPPHGCIYAVSALGPVIFKVPCGITVLTDRYDDRWLDDQLVWNVDIHVYFSRIIAEVHDLDQRGTKAKRCERREHKQ